jgi:hypothetical protein
MMLGPDNKNVGILNSASAHKKHSQADFAVPCPPILFSRTVGMFYDVHQKKCLVEYRT